MGFYQYHAPLGRGGGGLRRVVSLVASLFFIVYVSYLVWMSFSTPKTLPDPERQRVADIAVGKIVEQLKNGRGDTRSTILLHFENDPSDYFTDQLRSQLDATGVLILEERSLGEKFRNKLNLRNPGCKSLADALHETRNSDAQGVLWGTLTHFETSAAGTVVKGSWQLVDIKTGKIICSAEINEDTTVPAKEEIYKEINNLEEDIHRNISFFAEFASMVPWYIRFLIFVLFVLLLPIITIVFIRKMVSKRSNKINAFMLSGYTLFSAILAFFMVGGRFGSGVAVILFLIATGAAFVYNYVLMNFALKLES